MDSGNDSDHQGRVQPPGQAYHVPQDTRGSTLNGQTRLPDRFCGSIRIRQALPDRFGPCPGPRRRGHSSEGSDQRAQPSGHTMCTRSHAAQRWTIGHDSQPGWAGPPRGDAHYRQRFGPSSRTPEMSTQLEGLGPPSANLWVIPCTPGVSRRNAGRPGMVNCRAGARPTRRRRTRPDWSGLKLPDPGGVDISSEDSDQQGRASGPYHARRESHGINAGRPGMANCRTGASPTRIRRTLPDRSGPKLPDPGGADTARMDSDHQGRPPGYSMYAGSHAAQRRATGHGPRPD